MKSFVYTSTLLLTLLAGRLQGQIKCGTDIMRDIILKRDSGIARAEAQMNKDALAFASRPQPRASSYVIPVVFHVIHTGGAENISREQILDQIRVLNHDYSFTNWNKAGIRSQFVGRAVDCQIQFKLASIDPNGNCTDGVNRIYSTAGIEVDQTIETVKSLISWNTAKYLNIWVVQSIKSPQAGTTILGYSYLPGYTPAAYNGVVVRSDVIGSIGTGANSFYADSGRTLTHEIGHWLGLYHPFQDGCGGTDLCSDTPPVSQASINQNCPANGNSCTNDSPDELDLWEDYMDYANGSCMAMFTSTQKIRMHSFLGGSRSSNVSASNLVATGVNLSSTTPQANFVSNIKVVCAGQPVNFSDISCKAAVTARSWTFDGAASPSSTAANPSVVYQTPGKYKVTLLVQNGSGSNSKSVDQYIQVMPYPSALVPNFEEGFENGDPAPRGFVNTFQFKWVVKNGTGYTGSNCFKAPVATTDTIGKTFSFVTPAVDLSKVSGDPKITFYTGYAPRPSSGSETLRVSISTDCGNTFKKIFERYSFGLQYTGATATADFVPSQKSHWKLMGVQSLLASGYASEKAAIFRIDVVSNAGNPVYIDNLNISEWLAGVPSIDKDLMQLKVFPNPAVDRVNLQLESKKASNGKIELFDIMGRKVQEIYSGGFAEGLNKFEFSNPGANFGSLFIVKITTHDGQISKPITFAP